MLPDGFEPSIFALQVQRLTNLAIRAENASFHPHSRDPYGFYSALIPTHPPNVTPNSRDGIRTREAYALHLKCNPFDRSGTLLADFFITQINHILRVIN